MATESNVLKQNVKQKGYWDYIELYTFCFDWLKDNGYKLKEKDYIEKLSGFGKEIILDWEANKKVTDYFLNRITLKWHILGMKDSEVERDGKKIKMQNGEVKIAFSADLVKDYEQNWEKKPMWKFLRGIYDKYIVRTTIDEYEDRLRDDAEEFIKQVKGFLQLGGR